jgi:hypothetical protein
MFVARQESDWTLLGLISRYDLPNMNGFEQSAGRGAFGTHALLQSIQLTG